MINTSLTDAEIPLAGLLPKTMSEMSDEELRAHVVNLRMLRSSSQSLRAELAKKHIREDAQKESKIDALFGEL